MLSFKQKLKELDSLWEDDYKDFYNVDLREEYVNMLIEKLITVGGKAYPQYGNVVIMAGGAGSGKGFVKNNLLGMEGWTYDVDELKTMAAKTPKIVKRVKDEFGIDLPQLAANLKNPDNVSKLHTIIGDELKIDDRKKKMFAASVITQPKDRKPNVIFDVTLKDIPKLRKTTQWAKDLGYDPKNIHIVWVVNHLDVALKQNKERDRVVPEDILIATHEGAALTMAKILNMGKKLTKYMDGDIYFAFNQVNVDTELAKSDKGGKKIGMKGKTKGGSYIVDANYFKIKKAGGPVTSIKNLSKDLRAKISDYVPDAPVGDDYF